MTAMSSSKKRQRPDVQVQDEVLESPFCNTTLEFTARLPPSYIGRVDQGIQEILNHQLLKYDERLGGVLLSYSDISLIEQHGTVFFELPDIQFRVRCKALLFAARKGMTLEGVVSQVNSGHITLMVCGAFQVSIAKSKIPKGIKYNKTDGEWTGENENKETIKIAQGETIKLYVVAVHNTGGLWFIEGSLLAEDKSAPTKLPSENRTPLKRKLQSVMAGDDTDAKKHKSSKKSHKRDKKSKKEKKSKKSKKKSKH